MSVIELSIVIAAGPESIWNVVADLESISRWNPTVTSASIGHPTSGVGASRSCAVSPRTSYTEVVTRWEENRELWFSVEHQGAIRSAEMGIVLDPFRGGTRVTAIADYHIAFGPLGPVVDRLAMRRSMSRMIEAALAGLKTHVESHPMETPPVSTQKGNPT